MGHQLKKTPSGNIDLDLNWQQFSDTFWIVKLESWHWWVVICDQIETWTPFAILMMFLQKQIESFPDFQKVICKYMVVFYCTAQKMTKEIN